MILGQIHNAGGNFGRLLSSEGREAFGVRGIPALSVFWHLRERSLKKTKAAECAALQTLRGIRGPSFIATVLLVLGIAAPLKAADAAGRVAFNRDIRPILSDTCFPCHGFDANKRKADLRLDTADGIIAPHQGRQAVKPGDLNGSEMWRRVNSTDKKTMMPPPEFAKTLKPAQIELLGKWIKEGAVYQKHWSFEPPVQPELPAVKNTAWPRNEVDRFILATLESKGLEPSPQAAKETLIRRVTLDLTGLPPTLAEVDAFMADNRPDAYEALVDRLLNSPHYGEQFARYWLDVARYGDTHGLHLDNERSLWPYRDWVVSAFNKNLPYDKFTVWQLAGDLLPNPTREQMIASGYNRCNVSTSEGGAIDEEFQVRYAVDRVEATSTAWMGLTMGCAVCHDHKLDPITQREFYRVFAIFNNIAEKAMDGNALLPPPSMPLPTPDSEKRMKQADARISEIDKKIHEFVAHLDYTDPATTSNAPAPAPKEIVWLEDDYPAKSEVKTDAGDAANGWITKDKGPVFSGERSLRRSGTGLHQAYFTKAETPLTIGAGDKLFAYVFLDIKDPPKAIMLQYHTDEWRTRAIWGNQKLIPYGTDGTTEKLRIGNMPKKGQWVRLEVESRKLGLLPGTKIDGLAFTQAGGTAYWDKAGQLSINDPGQNPELSFAAWQRDERGMGDKSSAPQEIKDLLKKEADKLNEGERKKMREYYLVAVYAPPGSADSLSASAQPVETRGQDGPGRTGHDAPGNLVSLRAELKSAKEKREMLDKDVPSTMISKELDKPRSAWVLVRGQYDKHGDAVTPGVPAILPPLPPSEKTNRLTFAKWLVDPKHPLTARVTVNRFWQQFFGVGIVKTAEDFGAKGEWPSHPELLDWLATDFISGWDVKNLVRLIVTSATYRQDSRVTPHLIEADPENRLLARGPRFRLDAEEMRDNALAVSGLINLAMGGHAVRPYQPAGIWEAVGYTTSNTAKYTQDHGDALFRRSLYLFWKRTAPPPCMTTFDAPSREQCRARRERTNTPLQALLTMNDTQYFEAARQLGYRMLHEGGMTDEDRLRFGFRLVTARQPSPTESEVLTESLTAQRARYTTDAEAAKKTISVGESPVPKDVPAGELASYTMVANLLLNLDEVVTKN
ncbi:MAG: hypothetical protein C5B50_27200 [Verrucomicrobia bacterium]|nr:MAG: hypothetical protein C5B50_27200 [Verrucomicrobiota bacterium]